jgi:hypothetical protein
MAAQWKQVKLIMQKRPMSNCCPLRRLVGQSHTLGTDGRTAESRAILLHRTTPGTRAACDEATASEEVDLRRWSRTRFNFLLKRVEICCFQLTDIEPVASRSLNAVAIIEVGGFHSYKIVYSFEAPGTSLRGCVGWPTIHHQTASSGGLKYGGAFFLNKTRKTASSFAVHAFSFINRLHQ